MDAFVTHIKNIEAEKGKLNVDTEYYSGLLADCKVRLDVIQTDSRPMQAFPDCQVLSERLCITLCSDMTFYRTVNDSFLASVKGFSIQVDIPRKDGTFERILIKDPEPKKINRGREWEFWVSDPALIDRIINA